MSKILLLESDKQLGRNFSEYFKRHGHTTKHCADPQSAIISADSHRPDIVVLDSMLAGRSGIEFLYEMRSYPEWQRVPAIILGNYDEEEIEGFAQIFDKLNVRAYFHKPSTTLGQILAQANSYLQPRAI